MTGNSCCFVKTFPIVLFALFQIGCMNYRFKELSDNVYVVTLRQGDYLLHLDTRIEDNEFSYKTKIGDVKIKVAGTIQTERGDERTLEWKQEVAELRQGNSETWIIPGYGLNVDSRKNGAKIARMEVSMVKPPQRKSGACADCCTMVSCCKSYL